MAATPGVINGTEFLLKVDSDFIALSTSASLNIEQKLRDTSTRETNGYRQQEGGVRAWTMEAEGLIAFTNLSGTSYTAISGEQNVEDLIYNFILTRTEVTVQLTPGNVNQTGMIKWSGQAYITSVSMDTPNEDNSTFSVSLQGKGVLNQLLTGNIQ